MIDVTAEVRRTVRAACITGLGLAAVLVSGACSVAGDPHDALVERSVSASAFPIEPGAAVTRVAPAQLPAIAGDISGMPVGAQIEPPGCAPQPISALATDTVVQTGFGGAGAPGAPPPAYTTVITRTTEPLGEVMAAVARCGDYRRSSASPVVVTQRLLDQVPPVRGAAVAGYTRTDASPGVTPVTTTLLLAQRGDVRVYATRRTVGDIDPTAAADPALVTLFQAVAAVGLR
ncbi:hypothetical protein GCM10010528_19550 [Gordonia defluvii]|uniref:DUF5642 domain-containing protein n=1 Tax=Gordonia defluvii TaxID=283718 RepID=A0ABP6LBW3_9ACTN|nr:hypothetical protein [Gordonia sp. UBA5067]